MTEEINSAYIEVIAATTGTGKEQIAEGNLNGKIKIHTVKGQIIKTFAIVANQFAGQEDFPVPPKEAFDFEELAVCTVNKFLDMGPLEAAVCAVEAEVCMAIYLADCIAEQI